MTSRNALNLAVCVVALSSYGRVQAQQAPFTIRRPPDGATVREKVRIEIPRASIGTGGFVAIYLDGKFHQALAPEDTESSENKPFTFVWDTKGSGISDGEHTVRAVNYGPVGENATAATEKGASEVKLIVANKIKDGPSSLLLRYKYREGENLQYSRDGQAVIVGGVSQTGTTTSDQPLDSVRSKLEVSVEDVRYDSEAQAEVALVRNKLISLSILTSGQEVTLDPNQLSNSMYQELLPEGRMIYETGAASGMAEFTAQGLPINNTLELPLLPTGRVQVGDTWTTPNQRLDLPGMPPILQPKVRLQNKLVDLEWESGYPTAKIHQSYDGTPSGLKTVLFGPVEVTTPKITFERDIYIAYNSGTLIKTTRSLTVAGRTTSSIGAPPPPMQSNGPNMFSNMPSGGARGPGGYPGMPNMGGSGGGKRIPGVSGGYSGGYPGASGGYPGGSGGYPGGYPGASGGSPPGFRGKGGEGGDSAPGGYPGVSGGYPGAAGGYPGGYPGASVGSAYGGPGGMSNMGGLYGGNNANADHAITLKATTDTSILSVSGLRSASNSGPARTSARTTAKKSHGKTTRRHH
jgi:hypothetical protein